MKKNILITYFFPPRIGGVENYYHNLLSHFAPDDIAVVCQQQPEAESFDAAQKYHIYRTDFFGGKFPPRWLKLKNEIKEIISTEKAQQLIFGHFHPFNIIGKWLKLPYFVFGHGTDIRQISRSFWQKLFFKRIYGGAQKIIVNSKYLASLVGGLIGSTDKVEVVYPGVNYDELNEPAGDLAALKSKLSIAENDFVILSMGRLVTDKNYDTVIKAFPDVLNLLPNVKYIIAGDGPESDSLKSLVQLSGLDGKVIFAGALGDDEKQKRGYYQLAHLFVGVSRVPEGFGVAYLEAQACGNPVVASKQGGSAESVLDGQTGLLVEPDSGEQIAQAIYRILSDRELWQKMSDAGRERIKNEFAWQTQAEKIKQILG